MRQSKHLRSFRVRPVDENEWGDIIHQREAPELIGIELAMRIVADDAVHHHQHPNLIGLSDKTTQGASPVSERGAFLYVELERASYTLCDCFDVIIQGCGTDE